MSLTTINIPIDSGDEILASPHVTVAEEMVRGFWRTRLHAILKLGWLAVAIGVLTGIDKFGLVLDGLTHGRHPALIIVFSANTLVMANAAHRVWWVTFMAIAVPRSMIGWPIGFLAGKQAHRLGIRWRWWLRLKRQLVQFRDWLLCPLHYICSYVILHLPQKQKDRMRRWHERHEDFRTLLAIFASSFIPFIGYPALGLAGARDYSWKRIACVMLISKLIKAILYIKMGAQLDMISLMSHVA